MELQLVYRILRKISDWTVAGYYSEVLVLGQENALNIQGDANGPDYAKCKGERRHVSFWAKESMFSSAVGGWVMRSSGAIPVKRNPNNTTHALSLNKVVGVFPEGTSYTQPGIVQIMPGAARAAVEYEVWRSRNQQKCPVVIVPVGIVYTDKSRYQSRLRVQYGTPIRVNEYWEELTASSHIDASMDTEDTINARARSVSKAIVLRIEQALFELTINAPDWETLYAAQVARDIVFEDKEVPLSNWVSISQKLVDLLKSPSSSAPSESVDQARGALTKYFALLYHTNLTHAILKNIFPLPVSTKATEAPDWKLYHIQTSRSHLFHLCSSFTVANNILRTILILPILPFYAPAVLLSHLTVRFLATPGEEEGEAQFRAVGGGVGLGIGRAIGKVVFRRVWRRAGLLEETALNGVLTGLMSILGGVRVVLGERSVDDIVKCSAEWCNEGIREQNAEWDGMADIRVAHGRHIRLHSLHLLGDCGFTISASSFLLVLGRSLQIQTPLEDPGLAPYLALPPPPTNAFIRRRERQEQEQMGSLATTSETFPSSSKSQRLTRKQLPMSKLLPALLYAREEARFAVLGLEGLREATTITR
ncbi:hypothetical protein BT96DRAFT_1000396 [Gymnopus androsaceus JB14]|uniref:Phospholipid/glycerol acyltransferase domain-containing protein n=1 Tax=Gymnopus androsaceus JB14 TaxID=1447944 RepID=A0A6A4H512_9AGAR|nr:hypothetical protein BT96DRAFT_1000396 [Gymnopus androsaceus JB14]